MKQYWAVPLLVLWSYVIYIFARDDHAAVSDVLDVSRDSYKKQIEAINAAHTKEVLRKEENLKRYSEVIDLIEKEYELNKITLDRKKRQRIKKIVDDYRDNPESLTDVLQVMYGIEYVETPSKNSNNSLNS